jgi:hypothetical protein
VEALGPAALKDPQPWMASESFALFLQEYPGVLAFTGIANPDLGCGANHHTPEFDMDERGLTYGAAMGVAYALAFLNTGLWTLTRNSPPIRNRWNVWQRGTFKKSCEEMPSHFFTAFLFLWIPHPFFLQVLG